MYSHVAIRGFLGSGRNLVKKSLALSGITVLVGSCLVATAASSSAAPPSPTSPRPDASAVSRADQVVKSRPGAIAAASGESYTAYRSKVDPSGAAHVRYTRTYRGLRVYGGDFVIHTKAGGAFAGSSVGLAGPLTLSTTPKVSAAKAGKAATARFA